MGSSASAVLHIVYGTVRREFPTWVIVKSFMISGTRIRGALGFEVRVTLELM